MEAGAAWVEQLPERLERQKALLTGFIGWCRDHAEARWLTIGCSLARGNADWMSDLDLGLGVAEADVKAVAAKLKADLPAMGPLVACFHHTVPGVEWPHRRLFAQFADRSQVDLVVMPADRGQFKEPGVALYDPDGLVEFQEPYTITPEHLGAWSCLAWAALADCGKYLRRGSLWEALARVEEARGLYWRLLAVAEQVPLPQYGVTSLLDELTPDRLPPEAAATATSLSFLGVLEAARALGVLLWQVQDRLPMAQAEDASALGRFVGHDLDVLADQQRSMSR